MAVVTTILGLLVAVKPTVTGAKPDLRLPGDATNDLRQSVNPVVQLAADPRLHAIGPGAFNQGPSRQSVSRLGDSGPVHSATAGMLGGDQAEIGHQLPGTGEAF